VLSWLGRVVIWDRNIIVHCLSGLQDVRLVRSSPVKLLEVALDFHLVLEDQNWVGLGVHRLV
jgi:hypothetical protein